MRLVHRMKCETLRGTERKPMSHKFVFLALVAALFFPYSGQGQEMTEKYIPVDAYPQLAGKYLVVGRIVSVDKDMRAFALQSDGSIQKFLVANNTMIWLDRSLRKEANTDGTFSDLKTGLKAEVKVFGPGQMHMARWIKVQVTVSQ